MFFRVEGVVVVSGMCILKGTWQAQAPQKAAVTSHFTDVKNES